MDSPQCRYVIGIPRKSQARAHFARKQRSEILVPSGPLRRKIITMAKKFRLLWTFYSLSIASITSSGSEFPSLGGSGYNFIVNEGTVAPALLPAWDSPCPLSLFLAAFLLWALGHHFRFCASSLSSAHSFLLSLLRVCLQASSPSCYLPF